MQELAGHAPPRCGAGAWGCGRAAERCAPTGRNARLPARTAPARGGGVGAAARRLEADLHLGVNLRLC